MEKETLHCAELLKRINNGFETKINKDLKENNVTLSQMNMLICLEQYQDNSATLKELEKYFCFSQSTIAATASRLEKKALIESYLDPDDGRIKHIRLSDKGRELCIHAKKAMKTGEKRLIAALETEEQKELQRLLQKVYNSFK